MERINQQIKERGLNWKEYSNKIGQNPSNFKRKLTSLILKINNWLQPIGLKITITKIKEK